MDRLWVYVLCPIWSFIVNCLYWSRNIPALDETWRRKEFLCSSITDTTDVKKSIAKFKYTPDAWKDWTPWVITFLHRDKTDDCDGAAVYGQFLFSCIHKESEILHLRGTGGHAVCVTKDRRWMISNNKLVRLTDDWQEYILQYFGNKYGRYV